MDRLGTIVKNFLDKTLLCFFLFIVFLAIIRAGPFFCNLGVPCLQVQRETFILGYILSISASTFYGVLSFWVTIIGLLDIVLTFNKKAVPDFIVDTHPSCSIDKSRHAIEVPNGSLPLTLKIDFKVKNNGNLIIQEDSVNYMLRFPKTITISEITSEILNQSGDAVIPRLKPVNYDPTIQVLGAGISYRVFPGRILNIFSAHLTFKNPGIYNIYYYFITANGVFPAGIKCDKNHEPIKNLGRIIIDVK